MSSLQQIILNNLIIAETAIALILVFILLTSKKNKKANLFFSAFILIHSISFLPHYFWLIDFPATAYFVSLITMPGYSITGVFVYYYVLIMTGASESIKKKDLSHLLVFFVFLLIQVAFFKPRILVQDPDLNSFILPKMVLFVVGVGMINSLVYLIISLKKIRDYSAKIQNYFSAIEKIDMKWLVHIIYFPVLFLSVSVAGFLVTFWNKPSWYVMISDLIIFILMMFMSSFYIINQPERSKEKSKMRDMGYRESIDGNNGTKDKYVKYKLNILDQEKYLKMLNEYMERDKPYLNGNITIRELSVELDIPYYCISIAINNLLKKNYYDYINEYRIREVLSVLKESGNTDSNILSIAFKCGFNSKSTFNSVFKKIVGTTPSSFRDNLRTQDFSNATDI